MPRTKKWSELRQKMNLTPEEEAAQEVEVARLLEVHARYQHTLAELRKARQLTQRQLAEVLGVKQPEISQLEKRTDLYLNTLERYINGMGGELHLVVTFGEEQYELQLCNLAGDTPAAPERQTEISMSCGQIGEISPTSGEMQAIDQLGRVVVGYAGIEVTEPTTDWPKSARETERVR